MPEQKQGDQLELTYSSSVMIRDVTLKNLPEAMNDREDVDERGSGITMLAARHDDDDDIENVLMCLTESLLHVIYEWRISCLKQVMCSKDARL